MSHPYRRLALPEAIREIQERLWPDLPSGDSVRAIAGKVGVPVRVVYAWRSGETGAHHRHAGKLSELAGQANISITARSMAWGSGPRAGKRKKK